jgi:hypothetical protein
MSNEMTKDEATMALTLIDVGVKALGLKILDWPGGFAALESVCKKLSQAQQETVDGDHNS